MEKEKSPIIELLSWLAISILVSGNLETHK